MNFGRYEVLEELGRGGMGVVYRARDPQLEREVVIKVVSGRLDPKARARFEREADALGKLRHPNLVAAHDQGLDGRGRPYLVMRLIPGRSLKEWIRDQGPFAIDEAARIVERLCEGVAFAHGQGVLHRDLKPDNVLLAGVGEEPVLSDFGLALLVDRETRLTATGEVHGTPVYMPPEQADGNLELVGPASDVYGLGAILYCLLTGQGPFQGGQLYEVLAAVLSKPHTSARTLRPEVDPALSAIVDRCLQKDPRRRFGTPEELGSALEAWREGRAPGPGFSRGWKAAFAALGSAVVVAGGAVLLREAPEAPAQIEIPVAPSGPEVAERLLVIQPGPLTGTDTTVRGEPDFHGRNYGSHRRLHVAMSRKRGPSPAYTYLRFDLERLLPAKARIVGVTLKLRKVAESTHHTKKQRREGRKRRTIHPPLSALVHAVRSPWEEGTSVHERYADGVTWASQPKREEAVSARFEIPRSRVEAEWVEVDVTALAKRWWSTDHPNHIPNHGLVIVPDLDRFQTGSSRKEFSSSDSEADARPRLEVRYVGTPAPPAPLEEERWAEARDLAQAELKRVRALPLAEQPAAMSRVLRIAPFWGDAYLERGKVFRRLGLEGRPVHAVCVYAACFVAERAQEPASQPVALGELAAEAGVHSERAEIAGAAQAILSRLRDRFPDGSPERERLELALQRAKQATSRYLRRSFGKGRR